MFNYIMNRNQYGINEVAEALFPDFLETNISLDSMAEVFLMQNSSQRQNWPAIQKELQLEILQRLHNVFRPEGSEPDLTETEVENVFALLQNEETNEIDIKAEAAINDAMQRLITDAEDENVTSFTLEQWISAVGKSLQENEEIEENSALYHKLVQRTAEALTAVAFDDMCNLQGAIKLAYAMKGLHEIDEVIPDLMYEVAERIKEQSNLFMYLRANEIRKQLNVHILCPALREAIEQSRSNVLQQLLTLSPKLRALVSDDEAGEEKKEEGNEKPEETDN